jgi:23S rRNA pseudouridine1911/1915/1917 synthase
MNILYEDNHLLVVVKPPNTAVQADASGDAALLDQAKDFLKQRDGKPGEAWLGLVHRLDRPVGGVMVFAKTSKAASRLSDALRRGAFEKTYLAVLDGCPEPPQGTLTDWLWKDRRTNTVRTADPSQPQARRAELSYRVLERRGPLTLVAVRLNTGRSHQIRVQFASRGWPIWGDQRYHPHPQPHGQIALWSYRLSFPRPVAPGDRLTFFCLPPRQAPWNGFSFMEEPHEQD